MPVGLGTFPFSSVFSQIDTNEVDRIVRAYLDRGGRYIQTSPYYSGVDDLIGSILKTIPRDSYELGTLCVKDRNSNIAGSRDAIFAQCRDSLARLGCDYIDYYLTSTPAGSDVPLDESMAALSELRSLGMVRHVGVCNVTLEQLDQYELGGHVEIVQNRFSLIDQVQDRSLRDIAAIRGFELIPYNVIEWGLLTNKVLSAFLLREEDVRGRVLPVFRPEVVNTLRTWAELHLLPLARSLDVQIEALSIAWVLSQSSVLYAPVGATRVEQIVASMKANDLVGRSDVVSSLNAAYSALADEIWETHHLQLNDYLLNSFGKW